MHDDNIVVATAFLSTMNVGKQMRNQSILKTAMVTMMAVGLSAPGWVATSPKMKMTTTLAPGIAMPDKVAMKVRWERFLTAT